MPEDFSEEQLRGDVRLEGGWPRYARIPEWLIEKAGPRALQCYAVLMCFYADKESGKAFPSRRTIAQRMRCSEGTVDTALDELKRLGAVHVEPQIYANGASGANIYWVSFLKIDFTLSRPTTPTPSSPLNPPSQPATNPPGSGLPPPLAVDCEPRTIINEPESLNHTLATARKRAPSDVVEPKKTLVTQAWLDTIRPEWSPKLRDFDDTIQFATNSEYYRKKPDKQAYILGQLKRAAAREAEWAQSRAPVATHRGPIIQPQNDPNWFGNWQERQ